MLKAVSVITFVLMAIQTIQSFAQTTESGQTNWYCDNGGTPYCNCTEGWTGDHCQIPIDYCKHPAVILYNDQLVTVPLCVHGKCHYDPLLGSSCQCDDCWHGKYCQIANETCKHVSNRCIGYETPYTQQNKDNPNVVQHICDLRKERCIPDNLDCMFNVPVKIENGIPVCDSADGCKCKYPVGWCIPLEAGNNIMAKMAAKLKMFVDPHLLNPLL